MVARFINLLKSHFPEDSRFLVDKFQTICYSNDKNEFGSIQGRFQRKSVLWSVLKLNVEPIEICKRYASLPVASLIRFGLKRNRNFRFTREMPEIYP